MRLYLDSRAVGISRCELEHSPPGGENVPDGVGDSGISGDNLLLYLEMTDSTHVRW
jgi:hypothetical protein